MVLDPSTKVRVLILSSSFSVNVNIKMDQGELVDDKNFLAIVFCIDTMSIAVHAFCVTHFLLCLVMDRPRHAAGFGISLWRAYCQRKQRLPDAYR